LVANSTEQEFRYIVSYDEADVCSEVDLVYTVTMGDGSALSMDSLVYNTDDNTFVYNGEFPSDQTGLTYEFVLKVTVSITGYTREPIFYFIIVEISNPYPPEGPIFTEEFDPDIIISGQSWLYELPDITDDVGDASSVTIDVLLDDDTTDTFMTYHERN